MTFDLSSMREAVERHGRVARVVIAAVDGSAPREVGAAMLVWPTGQSGTIGGGALEYAAAATARAGLDEAPVAGRLPATPRVSRHPLGPALGQCCGGAVTLVTEIFDAAAVNAVGTSAGAARPVLDSAGKMPLAVARQMARARDAGEAPETVLRDGWLVEPFERHRQSLWIWGAGHVGRAIVGILSALPEFDITWIDICADRFPAEIPPGVATVPTPDPARMTAHAPRDASHLILTYSHALDLALCHGLLSHGFSSCGLIGSATKWARFHKRLRTLGHGDGAIARIQCPIGDPALGKHPQAIAIGVAAQMVAPRATMQYRQDLSA